MDKSWKQRERDAAALFPNATRYPANSGARFDFEGPTVIGQVKERRALSLEQVTQLCEEAAIAGQHRGKLGVAVLKVRRGRGRKSPLIVAMTDEQWQRLRARWGMA